MCCQLKPAPSEIMSVGFHDNAGFTLMVSTLDLTAWKRPIQSESYSVFSPKGALTPMPNDHCGLIGTDRYSAGMPAQLPASPPVPPRGWSVAALEPPSSLNFDEGQIRLPATTACMLGSRDIPAGLK